MSQVRTWCNPAAVSPPPAPAIAEAPRLLFVVDRPFVPPQDGSAAVYHQTLMVLAKHYRLSCLVVTDVDQDLDSTEAALRQWTQSYRVIRERRASRIWLLLRALARSLTQAAFAPDVIERWGRQKMRSAIKNFIAEAEIDILMMSKLHSLFFVGDDIFDKAGLKTIVDIHDDYVCRIADEQNVTRALCAEIGGLNLQPVWARRCWRSRISLFSPDKARRQERRLMRRFDRVLVSSAEELASYRSNAPDPARFSYLPWPLAHQDAKRSAAAAEFDAGFVGADTAFNLEAVLYFLADVLPLIRRQRPDFRFLLAGRVASTVSVIWRSTADFEARESLVTMGAFYDAIKIAVVPLLHGTGTSIKMLEALSFRCPVVTTPVGARGLDLQHGNQVMIGAGKEAFADGVLALCRSGDLRAKLAANGQAWVLRHHSAEAYLHAFAGAIAARQDTVPSAQRA